LIQQHVATLCQLISPEIQVEEKFVRELLRYGTSKLHVTSSYLGGVASQEAIKLIMSQFVPINHTLIFDGIHGKGQVFNI